MSTPRDPFTRSLAGAQKALAKGKRGSAQPHGNPLARPRRYGAPSVQSSLTTVAAVFPPAKRRGLFG